MSPPTTQLHFPFQRRFVFVSSIFFAFILLLALLQSKTKAAPARINLDTPFFSQTALRSDNVSSTQIVTLGDSQLPLWEYGCGVASLAMVYRQHGADTDVTRLNQSLRTAGAFAGPLLNWSNAEAFVQAGAPWIKGMERINTTHPSDYQARVDQSLADGEPVIAYLNDEHYVVLTGKDEDAADPAAAYRINDPWALDGTDGQNIPIQDNLLRKGDFDAIRQFVFISRQAYAPTNGIAVSGAIQERYILHNGARGSLGNPLAAAEKLPQAAGRGDWQRFEHGVIFVPTDGKAVTIFGALWEKYQQLGGVAKLGLPQADSYSSFVGPAVEWRSDLKTGALLWIEGERAARWLAGEEAVRADYFADDTLSGAPAYSRFESDTLFDWQNGAPGPWLKPDGFSARFSQTLQVGGLGWWYNFVVDADDGVRVQIDGETVFEAWNASSKSSQFSQRLGRGAHTLVVEYRERSAAARLLFAYSVWPATPVFAAEAAAGPFERLPASAADYAPAAPKQVAQATAAPTRRPTATSRPTANATTAPTATPMPTPTPDALAGLVGRWELRQEGGECFGYYEPVLIEFFADGLYAARVEAPANIPLGGEFTLLDSNRLRFELLGGPAGGGLAVCNFQLRAGELWIASPDNVGALYVNPDVVYVATATAEAQARATDEAEMVAVATARTQAAAMIKVRATAIATERAAVRATAAADMPAAIANLADRFDMIFLPVPAGEFTMGSSEAEIDFALEQCNKFSDNQCERGRFDDETPQHQVYVDDFWIMQTEVSNAQWQRFMQAGGYDEPAYWTATGWVWRQSENVTQPSCWEDGDLNQAQQPVVCVSWYEAVAYSRWLASESGLEVRLPTEAEWEKAARGADGRIFPWGDEWDGSRLNYCDVNCENDWRDSDVDDGYRHTAPVGGYAAGASPYGALDMAGNVWEWTSTLYQEYPYNADDGREELEGDACCLVLRGGSWDNDPVVLRPAFRYWGLPLYRLVYLGVRLVVFAPN